MTHQGLQQLLQKLAVGELVKNFPNFLPKPHLTRLLKLCVLKSERFCKKIHLHATVYVAVTFRKQTDPRPGESLLFCSRQVFNRAATVYISLASIPSNCNPKCGDMWRAYKNTYRYARSINVSNARLFTSYKHILDPR
jgi:hypothetical protein